MNHFDIGNYLNLDKYYKDEDTNEIHKDNINLSLKLGGYLKCRHRTKTIEEPISSNSNGYITTTIVTAPDNDSSSAVNSANSVAANNSEEYYKSMTTPIDSINKSFSSACMEDLNSYKQTTTNPDLFCLSAGSNHNPNNNQWSDSWFVSAYKSNASNSDLSNHANSGLPSSYELASGRFLSTSSLSSSLDSDINMMDDSEDINVKQQSCGDMNSEEMWGGSNTEFQSDDFQSNLWNLLSDKPNQHEDQLHHCVPSQLNDYSYGSSPYPSLNITPLNSRSGSPGTPSSLFSCPYDSNEEEEVVPKTPTFCEMIMNKFESVLNDFDDYDCSHCNVKFHTLYSYLQHCEREDLFKLLKYKCPVNSCPLRLIGLNKKVLLRKHVLDSHYNRKKQVYTCKKSDVPNVRQLVFTCGYCDKVFYRKDSLNRHLRLIH